MIPVREKAQFAQAIRTKVIREIADRPQVRPLVQPAQAAERANCLAGNSGASSGRGTDRDPMSITARGFAETSDTQAVQPQ